MGERSVHDEIYGERLRTLKHLELWRETHRLPSGADDGNARLERVVVASVQSLMQLVPQRQAVAECTRRLATGDVVDAEELRAWLVGNQYHATTAVQLPGEFAARGGIVDVFAADWDGPVRIELLGDQIESIRRFDLDSQRSVESLAEIEITVLRPEAGRTAPLTDYLTPDTWVLLVEPEQTLAEAERYFARLESTQGFVRPSDVTRALWQFPLATAASIAPTALGPTCRLQIESVQRFSGDIAKVRDELDRSGADHNVFLIAKTEAELQRLGEIFATTQLAQTGRLHLLVGTLYEGFRLVRERLILISGAELFQRGELRRAPRRPLGKAIDSFLELREGDLVVHLAHGIGRYRGMRKIEKHGRVEEHLQIEFHAGTKVYVPAQRIGLIQKYVGGTKSRPALARIGGKTWVRQKAAAEAAVVDLAAEMLEIQAARQARPGIAFAADSEWQQEFDTSFPYAETADQLASIEAIKRDMRQPRPMDRLLCGDVGLRQDRSRHAGGVQGRGQRIPGGRARPDHDPGGTALPHLSRSDGGVPVRHRAAQSLLQPARTTRHRGGTGRRTHRHRDRDTPPGFGRHSTLQPRTGDHRRRTALWRGGQGTSQTTAQHGGCADDDRHTDSAHAAHVVGRRARHLQSGDAPRRSTGRRDPRDAV